MQMKKILLSLFITGSFILSNSNKVLSQTNQNVPQLGKNTIAEVIKAMILEEKAALVVGKVLNPPVTSRKDQLSDR